VLPLALDRHVTVEIAPGPLPDDAYVRGTVAAVRAAGFAVPDVAVRTSATLEAGAGLASSAALEVALVRALRDAFGLALDDREVAMLAWRAETKHVGVPCGVMDQMAASLGSPGEALLIDCRSLEVGPVALPAGVSVVVRDSGVRHAHASGAYARRRAECEAAAVLLGVRSLRDVGPGDEGIDALPAPLDRRVRHVVEENARVLAFADALAREDLVAAGELMTASHRSQRDLFEVSVPEVDELVEALLAEGAFGARLTGGGFGGSVVALMKGSDPSPFG
jgi:galactokinase